MSAHEEPLKRGALNEVCQRLLVVERELRGESTEVMVNGSRPGRSVEFASRHAEEVDVVTLVLPRAGYPTLHVVDDAENAHQGQGVESLAIGPDDSIVFIFDVVDAYLQRAVGEAKAPVAGLPTVILAPNGQPGIQIPVGDAPTEFERSVLIEGSGAEIAIGDTVVVHYSGWTWEGEQFDSSWESMAPTSFQVSAESVIQGFVQSLEGIKIGSQVVAVIPPELGYGDTAQGSIPAGSTLIFVIDVLGKE